VPRGTERFLSVRNPLRVKQETRIMGVDPGIGVTGFGVIEFDGNGSIHYQGSGIFRTRPSHTFPQRLQEIFRGLRQQINHFAPHLLAIEKPFVAKNAKSAMLLGHARGVAILAAAEAGIEVYEYSPLEVKQAVVGYGRAIKGQVQAMIRSLLQTPPNLTPDAADALAVAICLAHSIPWKISMNKMMSGSSLILNDRPARSGGPNYRGRR
jgi:crossover junction endodeoxyribonuclease RuvC